MRQHLRLEEDETDQDELIQTYIDGAVGLIEEHCNTTFARIIKQKGKVPPQLQIAVMQVAAYWYRNAESADTMTLSMCPAATIAIINKFKRKCQG